MVAIETTRFGLGEIPRPPYWKGFRIATLGWIVGKDRRPLLFKEEAPASGTLVERSSRYPMLVHLPREKDYGLIPRTKNGSALAGYGAVTVADALKKTVADLPAHLWQSLTWDRGKELSEPDRQVNSRAILPIPARVRSDRRLKPILD